MSIHSDDEMSGGGSGSEMEDTSDIEMNEEDEEEMEMIDPEEVEKKINECKQALESNPTDYDMALELLKCIRLSADLEELMKTREEIVAKFPLPTEEWLKWIKDGKTLEYSREEMEKIFRRALSDSPSAQLWMEFAMWATGGTVESFREIIEDAITAIGNRVNVGGQIWHLYFDYEEALLKEGDDKQKKRVNSIYARSLRIPTMALKSLRERYDTFTGAEQDANIIQSFKNSLKQLVELEKWEDKLEDNDYSIETFHEYLSYVMESNEPSQITSFYERILEKHSLDENVWLNYTNYLTENLKIPSLTLSVYRRAVRYCASSCALWQSLLLAMEKANVEESEIMNVWPAAKLNIGSAEDGRALYRTYAFLLKRKMDVRGHNDYSNIAHILDEGAQVLFEYFDRQWDPNGEYRRMQAFFYYNKMKDASKGRTIWKDILKSGGGRLAERWIEAASLERLYGSVLHARTLFNDAVNAVSDHPKDVFNAFIQFEREEGTIEQLEKALSKVNAQLARRADIQPSREKKDHKVSKDDKKKPQSKQHGQSEQYESSSKGDKGRKREGGNDRRNIDKKAKINEESKNIDKDGFVMPSLTMTSSIKTKNENGESSSHSTQSNGGDDKKWTVFVSNLDFRSTIQQIQEVLDGVVEVRLLHRGMSKLHKGYGYVDLIDENSFTAALAKDRVLIKGRPMYVSECKGENEKRESAFKFKLGLEKNKLFVKNVHFDATPEQITAVFSQFGPVKEVRVVTHKSGKAKGVAYVDMEKDEDADKAVKSQDVTLLDRKLQIFLSNPPKKDAGPVASHLSNAPPTSSRIGHSSKLDFVPRRLATSKKEEDKMDDATSIPSSSVPLEKKSNDFFRSLFNK